MGNGRFGDENVSGKFEPSTQFPYLFYGEIALCRHEHRNRALRTELENQVALCQILLFNEKSHNRNRIYTHHRAEWLEKLKHAAVRQRAENLYEHLDLLKLLRQRVQRELLVGQQRKRENFLRVTTWERSQYDQVKGGLT